MPKSQSKTDHRQKSDELIALDSDDDEPLANPRPLQG